MAHPAGVPERPKGAGCKPAGSAYEGSNPSPCIRRNMRDPQEQITHRAKTPEGSLRSQDQKDEPFGGRLDLGRPPS